MNADFLLIRKMKSGDEKAFDLFIRKYYKYILNYCNYHCFDQSYAEDLTQETFVRFFANLSSYHFKGKTKNYLYTIARNLCKDFYKKNIDLPVEETFIQEKAKTDAGQMETVISKMTIEWAMRQLPEELQEIIILYYFQELKMTEIADVLGISLSLVKYRMRQAKIQLKRLLRKEDFHESGRSTYVL